MVGDTILCSPLLLRSRVFTAVVSHINVIRKDVDSLKIFVIEYTSVAYTNSMALDKGFRAALSRSGVLNIYDVFFNAFHSD